MNAEQKLEKALDNYCFAHEEMMRPQEDVVLLSACYSVKRAIRGFLEGYLTVEQVQYHTVDTLEVLMQKCIMKNPDFLRFNVEVLQCKCDTKSCAAKSYCMNMDQVKSCIDLMSELCEFVLSLRKPHV